MDQFQARRAANQNPLTKRRPVPRGPVGGRFVAHGLVPSTFQPMPKPRPIKQSPAAEAPRGRGVSVRLSPTKRNEDFQSRERPTGFTVGQVCSWCCVAFSTQPEFSYHRAICALRPGGPERITSGVHVGQQSLEHSCNDCGAVFPSRSARARHIREALCPLNERPSMCRKCGFWTDSALERMGHENRCSKEGAD